MIPFKAGYPYPSRRDALYGSRGMVATSHPLATEAGMAVFRKGGNAIDASVAAAAALSVVDPASTGPGGDLFAILSIGDKIYGLNASGHSPQLYTREAMQKRGFESIPGEGWEPVTVSGGVAGWAALCKRFGKLPMAETFAPAIELARNHAVFNGGVNKFAEKLMETKNPLFDPFLDMFYPQRKPLPAYQVLPLSDLADTLKDIAETEGETFYRGCLAEKMAGYSESTGGFLRYDDFASYQCKWVEPVKVNYRGYDILELPPNCQGITASIAINIMEGFEPMIHGDPYTVHRQIESIKLAFADAFEYIADPRYLKIKAEDLISKEYAAKRRALIGDYATLPKPGEPLSGGTVYLAAADGQGNMISLIQSIANAWGSGVVVPGTGILMQNRGQNFKMDENHPNSIGPRKQSYNTIIPGFISKDGRPVGPMGVMGGYMQPQGHLQVTMNMIDYGMNPQAALDAPRFFWQRGNLVHMEHNWPQSTLDSLTARGHELVSKPPGFGRGQIIVRLENGILCGGTEPRGGAVSAF